MIKLPVLKKRSSYLRKKFVLEILGILFQSLIEGKKWKIPPGHLMHILQNSE